MRGAAVLVLVLALAVLSFRESRAFAGRLRALGIAARTDFYGAGRHAWPYWERGLRRALPVLRQAWR